MMKHDPLMIFPRESAAWHEHNLSQLRHFRSLSLRFKLEAAQGMAEARMTNTLTAPDTEVWGTAGILAGILFRLGSYPAGAERTCLTDALVFLQGRKLGLPVLTGNIADFDFLNQLVPDGRILFYRRAG